MKMRCKLNDELRNEYFSHLSEEAFALMAEYDGGFDILKRLAFNDDEGIHIYKCKTMLEFTSLVATIGKYCNNENGEGYIIYKVGEYLECKEIDRGTMNSTDNSLQNHVYELLDATDMLVIVKSESYSNMGDFIRNSVTIQPRIDIMYMRTEEEKISTDDVCKTLSKEDIDKLNEGIEARNAAELIDKLVEEHNKPVDENDGLDLRWPNKLAKDLLASTLRTNIQNTISYTIRFNIPLCPARVAKVASNIINNIVLPNGLSIEKDTLKITCRICEKEDLKKAIDGNCLIKYAGNIGSDEDSTEVYDAEIYYGYNIVEAHLHEVIAYDPVFYSCSISSKIEGGTLSGDIDIYIMKASIVAEEE